MGLVRTVLFGVWVGLGWVGHRMGRVHIALAEVSSPKLFAARGVFFNFLLFSIHCPSLSLYIPV